MQEFLATGRMLYVLAGLCLLSIVCKWMTKSLYKRLMRETTNMAMPKNKNLKTLKQRIESSYRVNGGIGNMAAYLERQMTDFKFMRISLSGWNNFSNQLALLCFLAGGAAAFMAYWYRIDSYYIALYGTVGILAGLLTMVVDVGANIGEKRQQLLVALEDYMDNSLFFRPGKGRMAAAESEDAVRRPTVVARNQETGPVPVYEAEESEFKEGAAARDRTVVRGNLRGLRRGRRKEDQQPEPAAEAVQMKRSLEQTAASRDRDKADDGWLKDLKPEEVKILGDIIKEYLA